MLQGTSSEQFLRLWPLYDIAATNEKKCPVIIVENTVPHTSYTSVLPGCPFMTSDCQKGRTISVSPL